MRSSRQLRAPSRTPVWKPTSSFLPSGVAPISLAALACVVRGPVAAKAAPRTASGVRDFDWMHRSDVGGPEASEEVGCAIQVQRNGLPIHQAQRVVRGE